ncbi:MAG: 3-oxoacyl-ACP reductase FabG [Fretibacterium sp.]|nr:3-oxoacyl-ACP reductase FabG [Fretibacterium sp.]
MMGLLSGKSAIITGSSRGIGRAIAFAFAREGADVVIHGTKEAALKALQTELRQGGARCEFAAGDIGEYETSVHLTRTCRNAFGKIDILVNNAGINSRRSFADLTLEEWDAMLRTNLTSAFYACKCVVPVMLEQGSGCIINMSSSAGRTPHPNASISYGVSKAGLISMTQKLAWDLAPHGIRVNAICPGPIETDMTRQWTPEYREKALSSIPLRHLGREEDVAGAAVFLASELSAFVVGECVNVNGGKYMN